MQVSIAGAGGVAFSYAAFLASRGHQPLLWSPSGMRTKRLAGGARLKACNALEGDFDVQVADTVSDLAVADIVIIAVPAYAYRNVLDDVASVLRDGQMIILSAHLSFAAIYLSKLLLGRRIDCPIVVWNTTVSTGRQTESDSVSISLLRAKVEMAVMPSHASREALSLCEAMFGDRFALVNDMIGVDLGMILPQ